MDRCNRVQDPCVNKAFKLNMYVMIGTSMLANMYEMFTAFYYHLYLTFVYWFQVSLNTSLGISEPALMNIMKVTLQSHSEWFKIQMCPDPFAKILQSLQALV